MSVQVADATIEAVGLAGPGLPGWDASIAVLRGEQRYHRMELPAYQPTLLPPNERRRASPTVAMAFRVAEEATRGDAVRARELATVFVSADGDLQISQRLCTALAAPPHLVSPTDFHNSVHNAAAGYWSIASGAQGPSTAISAWDAGFAVGLLEAMGMVHVERRDTLLVVYDLPAHEPLWSKRPVGCGFGVALLLCAQTRGTAMARLRVEAAAEAETTLSDPELEALRRGNPAARALPLLQMLARQQSGAVHLAASNQIASSHDVGSTLRLTIDALYS